MENKAEKKISKKGFFARLFDKIDKKLEEKAKSGCCCSKGDNNGGKKSCCN